MHIAPDLPGLGADDERDLRMDFIADQPIDHMHALLLQLSRPLDVVGLVEPRAQFHHGRHLLAVVDRLHQCADDARVAAGAIERLLDRQHVRIVRRLLEKIHHAGKIFIRMMQQNVALADGGENFLLLAQRFGHRRDKRRVAEFGQMIAVGQHHQPRGMQRAINQIQVVLGQLEGFQQRLADRRGAIVVNLQPHRVALAAVVQFALHGLEQVAGFLLVNVQLAVPRDAKMPVAENLRAGK